MLVVLGGATGPQFRPYALLFRKAVRIPKLMRQGQRLMKLVQRELEVAAANDDRDILELLKGELDFIEEGGSCSGALFALHQLGHEGSRGFINLGRLWVG
jgi:hypothetical protein